jgi:hypothetical protein
MVDQSAIASDHLVKVLGIQIDGLSTGLWAMYGRQTASRSARLVAESHTYSRTAQGVNFPRLPASPFASRVKKLEDLPEVCVSGL